ncbi:MAG: DUF4038 domain-containing protein [Chloroflexota bacterium]
MREDKPTGTLSSDPFRGFLVDTWWFGLTNRLDRNRFIALGQLRASQGFNAIQLVMGVPPEVGPLNENARSEAGFPWQLDGTINNAYLRLARERIGQLNALGLKVIVYGAWGHQIAWMGREWMTGWWSNIVEYVGDLDIIFCLTGESNLWIGDEDRLLPDRTSGNLIRSSMFTWLPGRLHGPARRAYSRYAARRSPKLAAARRSDWGFVLDSLAALTDNPIIIHTLPGETAVKVVNNGHLLAANTIQTGHGEDKRDSLWQIPLHEKQEDPEQPFINLEPWYEGILGRFGPGDQLYAYWASMLAGASGHCYGAHGIWNVGDGQFLAHWGDQTFNQAATLDTPRLIGLSHKLWMTYEAPAEPFHEVHAGQLSVIGRRASGWQISFYPDVKNVTAIPKGRIWLPMQGDFAVSLPSKGSVVIISETSATSSTA